MRGFRIVVEFQGTKFAVEFGTERTDHILRASTFRRSQGMEMAKQIQIALQFMKAIKRTDAIWVYTPQANNIPHMRSLEHPDSFHLEAARGWLALGSPLEAENELERIGPKEREHLEVMEVWWEISARKTEWHRCVDLADSVIKAAPNRAQGYIHKSYALHELKRTQEAWDFLLPIAEKFPKNPTIKYNMACYGAQLGRMWEAEHWLKLAFTVGDEAELRAMALEDPDLKPLRAKIPQL
jgi:predicted Zn-dependent protease